MEPPSRGRSRRPGGLLFGRPDEDGDHGAAGARRDQGGMIRQAEIVSEPEQGCVLAHGSVAASGLVSGRKVSRRQPIASSRSMMAIAASRLSALRAISWTVPSPCDPTPFPPQMWGRRAGCAKTRCRTGAVSSCGQAGRARRSKAS